MAGPYSFDTDINDFDTDPNPATWAEQVGGALNDATAAATANVLVLRDAAGRAKFAAPSASGDAATKGYVDATRGLYVGVNAQTGTTYTLVLTDQGKLVTCSNAGAITLTVPPNSSVAFPVNSQVDVAVLGAGMVTVVGGSGVTVNGTPSLVTRAQYSAVTLVKIATDTWLCIGDLADA